MKQAPTAIDVATEMVNKFFAEDWKTYTEAVDAANVSLFKSYEPLKTEE